MKPRVWMRGIFRRLRAQRYGYQRQVQVNVSRSALEYNLKVFQGICGNAAVAPVLKSNAYGHGLVHVARILDSAECPFFVVDGYHEALILRNEGIRTPLLVMGFTPSENILCSRLRSVAFMVGDLEQLKTLVTHRRSQCRLHLKVDTGLHRHGVAPSEFNEALRLVTSASGLELEGIYSHFADASGSNTAFTRTQLTRWNSLVEPHRDRVRYLHIANTAGTTWTQEVVGNVARVGLGLYGYDTHPIRSLSLKPSLSVQSRLRSLRTVNPGERVGYGLTWQASEVTKLALVPTGYHACVDHRLSNKGAFRIEGAVCPIIGRVSMNTTMINIAQVPDVKPGQVVEIIASDPEAVNSVSNIASICGTTPHVILSGVSPLLRRVIVE